MSYIRKIGDKEYEFASEKAYKTYLNLAKSAAKQNGISTREAFKGNYQKYVDVNSPLIGAKKEETVQPVSPAQTVVPQYSDYTSLLNYANEYKGSAYANASALQRASYEAALKARQEAEALAEIQRKRGVVDASTMAEQQKATYGANAEQLGRMGLNVSGYSDYLNSQAYANGMAYRQAANAQATDIKRQATYQEALARLEADKAYYQATAEADKTYYGAMKEIEAAKIAEQQAEKERLYKEQQAEKERLYKEQQQKEVQQQTNYQNFMNLAIENGWSADQISKLAPSYGISTEDATKVAETSKALYGDNTTASTTLETSLAANEANKDFIAAAADYVELNYPDATDEQKKTFQASYIVDHVSEIDDSMLADYAKKINNGDYGTAGGEAIKDAFSQRYIENIANLSKDELKTVIDSGILTAGAQSEFETRYSNKYGDTKNEQFSISEKDSFEAAKQFGNFVGSNNPKSEQSKYIDKVLKMASNNELSADGKPLEEGNLVVANFGEGTKWTYKYLGNGKFEKYKKLSSLSTGHNYLTGEQTGINEFDLLRVPEGYVIRSGTVYKTN